MNVILNAHKTSHSRPGTGYIVAFVLLLFSVPHIWAQDSSSTQEPDPTPAASPISASQIMSEPESISGIKFAVDFGQMTTQFGTGSTYPKRSSGYFNAALVFDKALKYYTNGSVYAGAKVDFEVPFDMSDATGNPLEFGAMGGVFGQYRSFSIGGGFEARQFSLPSEQDFIRNPQLLYGIPVNAEFRFKRAMVQGGGTFWLANLDGGLLNSISNDPTDDSTTYSNINSTISALSSTQSSYDIKGSGGFRVRDNTWLRFNYIHRLVYFNLSGETGSADPNVMNFKQNQISGGIYFDFNL